MNLLDAPYEIVATHSFPVQTVAASPDGLGMLTGDTERQLTLWLGNEPQYTLDLKIRNSKVSTADRIRSVAFSPGGESFYVASGTSVHAFKTHDGSKLWSVNLPRFLGFLVTVPLSLDVDSSGRVAIASDNGTFGYRDSFGRKMRHWKHNACPRWIRWMQEGGSLIGSDSFSIRLWDAGTGETVRGYETPERVYGLEASPNGDVFAVRTLHAVQVYRVEEERPIAEIPTREGLPLLAFSPDGSLLAVTDAHGAKVYESGPKMQEGIAELRLEVQLLEDTTALSLDFGADSQSLLIGCSDGNVRRYEV